MRFCAVYASLGSKTEAVAKEAVGRFLFPCSLEHVSSFTDPGKLEAFDALIFFSPTYGDEELHSEMEDFLGRLGRGSHRFILCELGNYYGYDELDFGAARIMRAHLVERGWREIGETLSLDSLPALDHEAFERWTNRLNEAFAP